MNCEVSPIAVYIVLTEQQARFSWEDLLLEPILSATHTDYRHGVSGDDTTDAFSHTVPKHILALPAK